jgi:hypothetical protein
MTKKKYLCEEIYEKSNQIIILTSTYEKNSFGGRRCLRCVHDVIL